MLFKVAMTNVYDIENENKPKKVLIIVLICDHRAHEDSTINWYDQNCLYSSAIVNAIDWVEWMEMSKFEWDIAIKNGFNYPILLLNNCTMHWICSRARKSWHNSSKDDPNDNRSLFRALGVKKKIASVQNTHNFACHQLFITFIVLSFLLNSLTTSTLSKCNVIFVEIIGFSSPSSHWNWIEKKAKLEKFIENKKRILFRLRHKSVEENELNT